MRPQNFIESGIIEEYVLGALDQEGQQEVEQMAQRYPEVQKEIDAQYFALAEFIMQDQKAPPPHLKARVMKKLADLEEGNSRKLKRNIQRFLTQNISRIAGILLIISLMLNIHFYLSWQQTQEELAFSVSTKENQIQKVKLERQEQSQYLKSIQLLQNPAIEFWHLYGTEKAPDCRLIMYWNQENHQLYLEVKSLPEPPKSKQYQLWWLRDGKVYDAGLISNESDHIQKMKTMLKGQKFMLTLEEKGGVEVAQGALYAQGKSI